MNTGFTNTARLTLQVQCHLCRFFFQRQLIRNTTIVLKEEKRLCLQICFIAVCVRVCAHPLVFLRCTKKHSLFELDLIAVKTATFFELKLVHCFYGLALKITNDLYASTPLQCTWIKVVLLSGSNVFVWWRQFK